MCPHHDWSSDFDFDELDRAMHYIDTMYERAVGGRPMMKEKYGSIRYEFLCLWLTDKDNILILLRILIRATKKFPTVAAQIVDDMSGLLNEKSEDMKPYLDEFTIILDKYKQDESKLDE